MPLVVIYCCMTFEKKEEEATQFSLSFSSVNARAVDRYHREMFFFLSRKSNWEKKTVAPLQSIHSLQALSSPSVRIIMPAKKKSPFRPIFIVVLFRRLRFYLLLRGGTGGKTQAWPLSFSLFLCHPHNVSQ